MLLPKLDRTGGRSAGFSLIEVLIALAILGLALGAIAGVFGTGLLGHRAAADADTALAVAEEKLDAAGVVDRLAPGHSEGVFSGRFRWSVNVAPYEDKASSGPSDPRTDGFRTGGPRTDNLGMDAPAAETIPAAFRLFRIEVAVGWYDGERARQVTLATLRLAPAPPGS